MAALAEQIQPASLELSLRNWVDDDVLAEFYLRLKDEGLLNWLYYQKIPTLSEFLSYHRRTDVVYVAGYAGQILDRSELVGFGWADCIQRLPGLNKAQVSMCFYRDFQANGIALEMARKMVSWAFEHINLDVVLGTTPVRNRAAVRFMERLGFERIGVARDYVSFHGEKCDAVLSQATRERWRQQV